MKAKDRVHVWDKEKENSAGESKEKQRTKTQLSKNKSLDKKSNCQKSDYEWEEHMKKAERWKKRKKEKGGLAGRVDWRVVVHPLYFLWEEQRNWPQDYRLELITPFPLTVKPINFPPTPNYPLKAPQTLPPLSHGPVWTTCTHKVGAHEGEEGGTVWREIFTWARLPNSLEIHTLPLICKRHGKPSVAMGILACVWLWVVRSEINLRFVLTFPLCNACTRLAASLSQPRHGPIFILIVCQRGGKGV